MSWVAVSAILLAWLPGCAALGAVGAAAGAIDRVMDVAGVGKGREISGILLDNLRQGRIAADDTRKVRLNNRLRGLIAFAVASHQLLDDDAAVRLAAAKQLQRNTPPALLPLLDGFFRRSEENTAPGLVG